MWKDMTQTTPVSDDFCFFLVFFSMSACASVYPPQFFLSLSLITASPFLPPVARHPSSLEALWLYLSPFLLSSPLSHLFPFPIAWRFVCVHVVCL